MSVVRTMNDDRLIQGMAASGDFRVIAAQTTHTVESARSVLDLSPVANDALGRALTASLLLARLLEKSIRNQTVTLRFDGDGPLGVIIAEGNIDGGTRGYVSNPVPEEGVSDVGKAIGRGVLSVVRGMPHGNQTYTSQVPLEGGGGGRGIDALPGYLGTDSFRSFIGRAEPS